MTGPGGVGPVPADAGHWFTLWYLREQLGQHRRISHAVVRDLDGTYLQCVGINTQVHLAPLAALEGAGLVKGEDAEVDIMGIMGKPTGAKAKIKRYTLTDAAKPFVQEKEVASIGLNGKTTEKQTDLCWGKKVLDKLVKWEGPMKFSDYQEAGRALPDDALGYGLPVLEKVRAMKPTKEAEQYKAPPPPKNYGADISTLIRMIEAGEL